MSINLWIEYLLRFAHLVAGIAWIGSSFYFIWLDSAFTPPETPRHNVEGEVFMVHGGFYYQVEKRKIAPNELPKTLHWFKWEATLTWLTGLSLLIFLYYLNGASFLVDSSVMALTQWQAVGLSLGLIGAAWLVYDFIWNPNIFKSTYASLLLSAFFFAAMIALNFKLFSGRGAFMQTGATLGTMMLANVWMRILPGQGKMLADAQAGRIPDYSLGAKSKVRSVHNTYFIFPVLFIMISNHFPTIYNHTHNIFLLVCLSISGALVRHAMVTKKPMERWTLAPAAAGLAAIVYVTALAPALPPVTSPVTFAEVKPIIERRCQQCHSRSPTDDIFKTAPNGLVFETESQLRAVGEKLHVQVVVGKSMPLGNKTHMTDEERAVIEKWLVANSLTRGVGVFEMGSKNRF